MNISIKYFLPMILFLVMGSISMTQAERLEQVSGYFLDNKGITTYFYELAEGNLKFYCYYLGKSISIPMHEISKIIFGAQKIAQIFMKDGRKFVVSDASVGYALKFLYYNEINKKKEWHSKFQYEIAEIVIDEETGNLKMCPSCGSIYPASFLFCPQDGCKLVWSKGIQE